MTRRIKFDRLRFLTNLALVLAAGACASGGPMWAETGQNGSAPATPSVPIILDTDPGVDDAMAILLALNAPQIDLKAITVVPGNVTAQQGLINALQIVSLSGRCNVPVAAGAQRYLSPKFITGEVFHGRNGIGNIALPPATCEPDHRVASDLIVELVHKYPHQLTLVAVGPETNLALAIMRDPSIVPLVKRVVLMAGSLDHGNTNAAAEMNVFYDPEAAQIVFDAGWPITMVDLLMGEQTAMTMQDINQLAATHGPQNDFAVQLLRFRYHGKEKSSHPGAVLYDPLAVAVAMDPTLLRTEDMRVDIETKGEFTRGATVANRTGTLENDVWSGDRYMAQGIIRVQPNVSVGVFADGEKFRRLMLNTLAGK
jgi:inosine-uridine nucleoside N-ribohydrolase